MILLSFSSDIEANSFYKAMVTAVNRLKRSQNQSSTKSAKADTNPQNEAAISKYTKCYLNRLRLKILIVFFKRIVLHRVLAKITKKRKKLKK